MTFHIITIFPEIFDSYFKESIIGRAQKNNFAEIKIYDLRTWASGRHRTVDDKPYGGGAGMVLKAEPIIRSLKAVQKNTDGKAFVILTSARGKVWKQANAKKYSKFRDIIIICGRYEGVDERINKFVDEEISLGEFVLTGGEIPAMAIVDSIIRLIPGALGNIESSIEESHSFPGSLEYPHYTRPEIFEEEGKKYRVPKILLSGDHKKIDEWRMLKMKKSKNN
jgi:tRNA (guanine37-N1)-methyltransferase